MWVIPEDAMPNVQPLFDAEGRVSLVISEPSLGVSIIVDPVAEKWTAYQRYAARAGCVIGAVLGTRAVGDLAGEAPDLVVGPESVNGDQVQVRLGDRTRSLPLGLSRAVVRVRGLFIGVVVVSARQGGKLAFVIPDGAALIAGGQLCAGEHARPVPIDDLVPDWTLGLLETGTVYCTTAPNGIFTRPIAEEIVTRETTRSRILRRLKEFGAGGRDEVVAALGLDGSEFTVQ